MKQALQVILLIAIIVLGYLVIDSPMKKVRFDESKDIRDKAVISRLVDIRTAQISFKEKYGYHTASFDTLISFIKNDSIPMVLKEGFLNDSMINAGITEEKAVKLGLIIRDTSYVPVMVDLFGAGFAGDSLRYIPFSEGEQFEMGANIVTTASNVSIKVFEAKAPYETYLQGLDVQEIINLRSMAKKYDKYPGLKVGDLFEANNYAGNWE